MVKKKPSGLLVSLILFFAYTASSTFAMDWPVESGQVINNFGMNAQGLPNLGISYAGSSGVYASADGELLFQRREGDIASRLPSPLGSWIAIDHGDGIISIYSRFNDSLYPNLPVNIERGHILGETGISGWSSRAGLYFQLFDRRERRWINPSMIITGTDARAPLIHSVFLRDSYGNLYNPSSALTISQGRYVVIVNANDTVLTANDIPLAPYRITCILNGTEAGVLLFETYSARDGQLMVNRNGLVPVRQVFSPIPAFEAAELWFSSGQTTLEIIVQDIAGNTRNIVYRFMVE